jgi:hypothetical protein
VREESGRMHNWMGAAVAQSSKTGTHGLDERHVLTIATEINDIGVSSSHKGIENIVLTRAEI